MYLAAPRIRKSFCKAGAQINTVHLLTVVRLKDERFEDAYYFLTFQRVHSGGYYFYLLVDK
jgi:hypothetical protein